MSITHTFVHNSYISGSVLLCRSLESFTIPKIFSSIISKFCRPQNFDWRIYDALESGFYCECNLDLPSPNIYGIHLWCLHTGFSKIRLMPWQFYRWSTSKCPHIQWLIVREESDRFVPQCSCLVVLFVPLSLFVTWKVPSYINT